MTNKRKFLIASILSCTVAATAALAGEKQQFDAKAFEAAQVSGKPILVEVTAPWCPTCKAQAPIIQKLTADPKFKDLKIFNVDFDSRKDLLQQFNVRTQSTLIVFKGKIEQGRSTGDTKEPSIAALLDKAI
jgi:thiol-disulfide isomerase/thioredoxin